MFDRIFNRKFLEAKAKIDKLIKYHEKQIEIYDRMIDTHNYSEGTLRYMHKTIDEHKAAIKALKEAHIQFEQL